MNPFLTLPCHFSLARTARLGLIAVLFASLAWNPAPAQAGGGNILYVAPNISTATTCTLLDPCSLSQAFASISDGDTIQMAAGIYTGHGFSITTSLTISGPVVPQGSPPLVIMDGETLGRVLLVNAPGKTVNLQYLTIRNGKVTEDVGAGIYCLSTTLSLTQMYVQNNTLISSSGNGYGGGIGAYNCTLSIQNSLVSGNSSGDWGGGIGLRDSQASIANTIISGNHTDGNYSGGGLSVSGGATSLNQVTISGNTASGGAGLFVNAYGPSGSFTMINSTVSGNHSTFSGGAMVLYNQATITNSTISGNQAGGNGGAVYLETAGVLTLNHVTLANNTATWGDSIQFSFPGTALNLSNSILAGPPGIALCAGSPTVSSSGYNIISDTSCPLSPNLPSDRKNTDPKLGPLGSNGGPTLTHLPFGNSLAINLGNPYSYPATDQRGVSRPQGGVSDIGAVEYRAGEMAPVVFLPLVSR